MAVTTNTPEMDPTGQPWRSPACEWKAESPATGSFSESARLTPEQNAAYERDRSREHAELLEQKLNIANESVLHEAMVDAIRACDMLDGQQPSLPPFTRFPAFGRGTFQTLVDFYPIEYGVHRSRYSSTYSPSLFSRGSRRNMYRRPPNSPMDGTMYTSSVYTSSDRGRRVRFAETQLNHARTRMRIPTPIPSETGFPWALLEDSADRPNQHWGQDEAHSQAQACGEKTGGLIHGIVVSYKKSRLGSWKIQSGKMVKKISSKEDTADFQGHVKTHRQTTGGWFARLLVPKNRAQKTESSDLEKP